MTSLEVLTVTLMTVTHCLHFVLYVTSLLPANCKEQRMVLSVADFWTSICLLAVTSQGNSEDTVYLNSQDAGLIQIIYSVQYIT